MSKDVEDLRQQADEAMAEAHHLAQRLTEVDDDIRTERERISSERIAAARRGESPMQAVSRDRLAELEAEKDELPELHLAARLRATALTMAIYEAEAERLTPMVEAAGREYRRLRKIAEKAQQEADEAHAEFVSLDRARGINIERAQEHEALLRRLEQEGPVDVPA